jgi:hypothetical protein
VQKIREIDTRIRAVEQQLEAAAAQALSVRQLLTIPGIGLSTATGWPPSAMCSASPSPGTLPAISA